MRSPLTRRSTRPSGSSSQSTGFAPAATQTEGPKALFHHAVGWLRRNRVLLPGVGVLAKQVSEVRMVKDVRLHATFAGTARGLGGDAEDAGRFAVLC